MERGQGIGRNRYGKRKEQQIANPAVTNQRRLIRSMSVSLQKDRLGNQDRHIGRWDRVAVVAQTAPPLGGGELGSAKCKELKGAYFWLGVISVGRQGSIL